MRLPLWIKLPAAFAVVLAVVGYSAWQSIQGTHAIEDIATHRLRDDTVPGIREVGRIGFLVASIRGDFWRLHAVRADEAAHAALMDGMQERKKELARELAAYEAVIGTNEEDRKSFDSLKASLGKWLDDFEAAFAKDAAGDEAGFTALGVVNGRIYADELSPRLRSMLDANERWIDEALSDTLGLTSRVQRGTELGTGIAIGIGLVVAVLLCLHILVPLARCRLAVNGMAQGRVGSEAGLAGLLRRGDELGDIARSTNGMAGYLREMAGTAGMIAVGNLQGTVTPRGSDDALGTAFRDMHQGLSRDIAMLHANTKSLAASSQELTSVSSQMAVSAEESSVQSAEVSNASEQVHRGISSVASAIEEMDASVRGIAASTQDMATRITGAAGVATALDEASKEVGDIIKTVQSTADRTNLLALNATIEAASAGEAGRGFAVVAHEVKELAKQSHAAAEQADRILTRMRQQAAEVSSLTKSASEAVLTVASAVEEQSATVNDISRNMGDASRSVAQIASSIAELATAGRDTASGVVQVKGAADDLARQTEQIATMVGRFKLPA